MKKNLYLLIFLIILSKSYFAQDTTNVVLPDSIDFSTLSLEELIQMKSTYKSTELEKLINQSIDVASKKPLSLKKSPSVISLITADEIEKSGAVDLIDVLKMIPGIEFNVDVQGVIGISIRGLWAQEGKVLILYDGQEMNETAFATAQFVQRYPINQIKKIEVIRGPGSASYGGFAAYAVINIVTKSGEELKGGNFSSIIGQTENTYARQNINFAYGNKHKDFTYSINGFIQRGNQSNLNYKDIIGDSYSMANNSSIQLYSLNVGLKYKSYTARFIKDNFYMMQRDQFNTNLSKAYPINFLFTLAELGYQKQIFKNLLIQGKVNYKNETPWNTPNKMDSIDNFYKYNINVQRFRGNISAIWDINRSVNIVTGFESFLDYAIKKDGEYFAKDSIQKVTYINYAPYIQSLIKTRFANITVGMRYDFNTSFGSSLNPRLGITKKIGPLNFKALYASSFRAPVIENYQLSINESIKPEQSKTYEIELGYQLNKHSYFSLNAYDISTKNSIKYLFYKNSLGNTIEGYDNINKTIGSQGIEFEYKLKTEKGTISTSYSFYTIRNKGVDVSNLVETNKNSSLGIANHKMAFIGTLNLSSKFFISTSASFLGKRYGYTSLDSLENGVISTFNPQLILNQFITYKNSEKGLILSMGINNLTNEKIIYIQPYNSLHAPLPGMGREFIFKISYTIKSKWLKN